MKIKVLLIVVICTTTISAQVQKIKNLQITGGGTPGLGKVLVSDANGNASWQSFENSVETVISSTGKIWMDRNLGASRVATYASDYLAYGSLYQWGRGSDGHELINWTSSNSATPINSTTTTMSTTDNPGNLFIRALFENSFEWRNPQNNNLWQGVNGTNNPCLKGYRIPTATEVQNEINAYNITNATTAYNSVLKIPSAGYRSPEEGFWGGGITIYLWTSTISDTKAVCFGFFYDRVGSMANGRAFGSSVRCIKD